MRYPICCQFGRIWGREHGKCVVGDASNVVEAFETQPVLHVQRRR